MNVSVTEARAEFDRLVADRDAARAVAAGLCDRLYDHVGKQTWFEAWAEFDLAHDRSVVLDVKVTDAMRVLRAVQDATIAGL